MGLLDDLEAVLSPLGKVLADLFTDVVTDDDGEYPSRDERLRQMLYGPDAVDPSLYAPGSRVVPAPGSGAAGALPEAVDQAGDAYQRAGGAAAVADTKLAEALKQIFASNDALHSRILGVIQAIEVYRKQIADSPLANDPHTLKQFQDFVQGQLREIQTMMDAAKVDSVKQAELLAALKDDYHAAAAAAAAADQHITTPGSRDGAGDPVVGAGGGGGDAAGGAAGDPGAGAGGLADPLAGLGLPAGLGAMADPISMLAPALAGMSSIPGGLGGLASSLPMGALGMAPLAGQLAGNGSGDGFRDDAPKEGAQHAEVVDDHRKDERAATTTDDVAEHAEGDKKSEASATPLTGQTPAVAAPASADGDPALVVAMPDGSPVTAASAQHASAMRAVLAGASVSDGWKAAQVDLPPPGTAVTEPADPSHLTPGAVAQFRTRDPAMYMGNGKIWLDGQLQPHTALPAADFLGWVDPKPPAGATAVTVPPPRAPTGRS